MASDDGKVAYISNYERGTGHTIARVDLVKFVPLTPIELGPLTAPHGLAFFGGKLYFTAEGAKVVARWDPATEKVDWIMGTGKLRTHMVVVKDEQDVFTSDDGSANISFIEKPAAPIPADPNAAANGAGNGAPRAGGGAGGGGGRRGGGASNGGDANASGPGAGAGAGGGAARGGRGGGGAPSLWNIDTATVAPRSEGFALSPDGKELWVANANQGTISVFDVPTRKIVQEIPSEKSANRIKFSPDGKYVLVPSTASPELLIVDAAAHKEFKRIALASNSEGVVITPDGNTAYVTLNSRGGIAVIDLKTFAVVNEVKTGQGPDGLAWANRN